MKVKDIIEQLNHPVKLEDDFLITFNNVVLDYEIVSDDGLTQIVIKSDLDYFGKSALYEVTWVHG